MKDLFTFGGNTDLLNCLLAEGCEFLVVGGMAVQFYCEDRLAEDLDLLINNSVENSERIANALKKCGLEAYDPRRLRTPKLQISLKTLHYADLMTISPDQDFARLWANRREGRINDFVVPFISLSDLLQ